MSGGVKLTDPVSQFPHSGSVAFRFLERREGWDPEKVPCRRIERRGTIFLELGASRNNERIRDRLINTFPKSNP